MFKLLLPNHISDIFFYTNQEKLKKKLDEDSKKFIKLN